MGAVNEIVMPIRNDSNEAERGKKFPASELVVTRGDAAEALEPSGAALDDVAVSCWRFCRQNMLNQVVTLGSRFRRQEFIFRAFTSSPPEVN